MRIFHSIHPDYGSKPHHLCTDLAMTRRERSNVAVVEYYVEWLQGIYHYVCLSMAQITGAGFACSCQQITHPSYGRVQVEFRSEIGDIAW